MLERSVHGQTSINIELKGGDKTEQVPANKTYKNTIIKHEEKDKLRTP